jgi:phosphate starvation-inducible PhoH-like protein
LHLVEWDEAVPVRSQFMSEATIPVVDSRSLVTLFGIRDQNLRQIRDALGVSISSRNDRIHIEGNETNVAQAATVFEQLKSVLANRGRLLPEDVSQVLTGVLGPADGAEPAVMELHHAGRTIRPRTPGQARYVSAIRDHDLTFCIGPAGTGKTYLAVAMAVQALKQEQIRKIVLVRPAVEAGESLGFLPGDLQAKINPYLRPLLDALREMMDYDVIKRYTEQDLIEMIPLAYMRGRTLNEAFVILDEAQNTTVAQMKMFLTRMGLGTKMVVSGDTTQIDLPTHARSGLVDAIHRLQEIDGFCHVTLGNSDIVRHRLVQQIVLAYDAEPKRRPDSR